MSTFTSASYRKPVRCTQLYVRPASCPRTFCCLGNLFCTNKEYSYINVCHKMYVRNSLCPWSFHMFGNAKQLNYLINAMEKEPMWSSSKTPLTFMGPKFITVFKGQPAVRWGQLNPVHALTASFFAVHFKIDSSPRPEVHLVFIFVFSYSRLVCISCLFHACVYSYS